MTVHFTGPVKNRVKVSGLRRWFSELPMSSDPDHIVYFNDFKVEQDYAAADWVVTTVETGAGDASEALAANELGGALLITNDAADDDSDSLQLTQDMWAMAVGKRAWFETRIKVSDATQSDLYVGIGVTDTTPLVTSDRVGFQKDDGSTSILCKSEKNATETSTDSGKVMADDTYVKLGFYWDGINKVEFSVDRTVVATHSTNNPDDINMTPTIHLVNGEAVAKTATIDYIFVCQER